MKRIIFIIVFILLMVVSVLFLFIGQLIEVSREFRIAIVIYQVLFYVLMIIMNILRLIKRKGN